MRWRTSGRRWRTPAWRRRPTQVVEQAAAEEAKKRDTATGPATVMVEVSKSINQMSYIVESSDKVTTQLAEKLVSLTPGSDWAMFAKVSQLQGKGSN